MNIDSATLFYQIQQTYQRFDQTYENVLSQYYGQQADFMQELYVNRSRRINGIVFVDGTFEVGSEFLSKMFYNHSTCITVCAILMPAERKQICGNDVSKFIYFENLSLMRYMSYFFDWLESAIPKRKEAFEGKGMYNNTHYDSLKYWLRSRPDQFLSALSLEHLQSAIETE